MSRGARRRRGGRGRRPGGPGAPGRPERTKESRPDGAEHSGEGNRRRRRAKGGSSKGDLGLGPVLEGMSSRPATLTMLPPDGTVLEELIAEMEAQYGFPATPQEYRLIIKVAAHEEPKEVVAEGTKDGDSPPRSDRRRSRRNRRRSRRRPGPQGGDTPTQQGET